jgi:hypothetical protein
VWEVVGSVPITTPDCKDYKDIFHFSLDFRFSISYIGVCPKDIHSTDEIPQEVKRSELDSGKQGKVVQPTQNFTGTGQGG